MDRVARNEGKVTQHSTTTKARRIVVQGLVQGVGFRPYIYRLAVKHHLSGWVRNCLGQVEVHVQGNTDDITAFEAAIICDAPAIARPVPVSSNDSGLEDIQTFTILDSITQGEASISVPTDLFTCNDCLAELNDPADRRYRYPFINCTQCGPRYTLIRELPYDRPSTTMAGFKLCPDCLNEYLDPVNRRYHAEPVACPVCGPVLEYKSSQGKHFNNNEAAIAACVKDLKDGKVVAVKGIGGYHLMCDASNDVAVLKLRNNKPRPDKPLALMFPSTTAQPFADIDKYVILSNKEKEFLLSPSRPILLAKKLPGSSLSEHIAPGLNELGLMLAYSPLHHLLLNDFGKPLVATSANLSGEPVLIDNGHVEKRLGHVAEAFLHHNRPIERPADDAVFRTICGKAMPIRLGRGFAPLELQLPFRLDSPVLAVGAHMKNTITLAWENRAIVSPHIGEMDNARSFEIFEKTIQDLQGLYQVNAEIIVRDAHPGYTTTRWANRQGKPVYKVLHHHAHASAAYYEASTQNDTLENLLVFTWDGVGYGEDGSLWGGEALSGRPGHWSRFASLKPFRLPGGDRAGREPWRSAAAVCWESGITNPSQPEGTHLLFEAWQKKINSPPTSAAGRLFDAAAALTGLCTQASYEGQGPMALEACYAGAMEAIDLPLNDCGGLWSADWQPLLPMLIDEQLSVTQRSSCFHASLAGSILKQSQYARDQHGITDISFSGGVFQNRILTELATSLLQDNGFSVHFSGAVPVNDAGISFGQIIEFMNTNNNTTR